MLREDLRKEDKAISARSAGLALEVVLGRIALGCGVATVILGGVGLLSGIGLVPPTWEARLQPLAVAPLTSLAFIAFGIAIVLHIFLPGFRPARMSVEAIAALVSLTGLAGLVWCLARMRFGLDWALLPVLRDPEINRVIGMSVVSGANLLLAGFAMLLMITAPTDRRRAERVSVAVAAVVLLVGAVVFLNYLHGVLLLPHVTPTPEKLTTILCFITVAIGLIAISGPDAWPLRTVIGTSVRARLLRSFIPVTVAMVLTTDLLSIFLRRTTLVNPAIVSTLMAVLLLLLVAVIVTQISRVVTNAVERIETERDWSIEALRRSEEILRRVLDVLPVAVCLADETGRIVTSNPAAERLCPGRTHADAVPFAGCEAWWTDTGEPVREEEWPLYCAVKDGESTFDRLIDIQGPEGTRKTLLCSAIPVRDQDDRILGGIGVFQDITEQRRVEEDLHHVNEELQKVIENRRDMEQALRESEERYRAIFEQAADSIVLFDADTGELVEFNTRAYTNLGYTREEFANLRLSDIEAIETAEQVREHIAKVAREGADTFETRHRTKDGQLRNVLVSACVVPVQNRTLVQGIWRDITPYREVQADIGALNEEMRRRANDLATLNHELESFTSSVSHDLRAPLRSIEGFSRALLEEYGGRLDAQGLDYLRRVGNACLQMQERIDDLLNLSRVSRSELHREQVDLSEMANAIVAEMRQRQPERTVQSTVADGLIAEGDPTLLRILLQNLLDNAWKFTSQQDDAHIEFGAMQWERDEAVVPRGRQVYFVRDNGVGFDMTYADKLFTPFQRLHTPDEYEGTGISLATVQCVVHRHGGCVWAESATGRGATFYFTLQGA